MSEQKVSISADEFELISAQAEAYKLIADLEQNQREHQERDQKLRQTLQQVNLRIAEAMQKIAAREAGGIRVEEGGRTDEPST